MWKDTLGQVESWWTIYGGVKVSGYPYELHSLRLQDTLNDQFYVIETIDRLSHHPHPYIPC